MEKVTVTQEQVDAVKLAQTEMPDYVILEKHRSDEMWTGAFEPMNRLSAFTVRRVLENDYDVEGIN